MSGGDPVKPVESGLKLTYDDFVLFPDDGNRHEIIDGEHYVTPCPNRRHQIVLGNLHFVIAAWLETNRIGRVMLSPMDVLVSRHDIVEPDLLYMSNEREAAIATDKNLQGSPELVIEIESPSTRKRDATIKRQLYERAGASEYWILDPELDRIRVYRRQGERFARALELTREAGDVLTTALLPGLQMPLARIFRE